jgi:sugar phosphate isomerase/epimerase
MTTTGETAIGPLGLPIGCQVWPLRTMIGNFPEFVKSIAGIGVRRLELCSPIGYGAEFSSLANAKEVVKILANYGMKCESSHFKLDELRHSFQKSIDWAKEIGIKQVIVPTLGDGNGGDKPTFDQVKNAADEFNKIAAFAANAGLEAGVHNEGFELSTVDGKRTYDLLFELLDPKLVNFQFQMSTIGHGFIAADYFTRYPGRFYSLHLQDIDMSAPLDLDGRRPQVAIGTGSIDWRKTFATAKAAGVRNYFVEQNWELTQQSVENLKKLATDGGL